MEISAIFLILAVIILVGLYLYVPFLSQRRRVRMGESQEISALQAERDRVINSLQELDFDYKLGKVPSEDYPEQRTALLQKGADVLRKLDEVVPAASSTRKAEDRVEKAVAAGRADASTTVEQPSDDDLESMIEARRKQHGSRSAGFCPKCGKAILASDKFCPSCGKSLK